MMMGPGQDQGYIDPQMNNQPLAFNAKKGKPPMPIEGGSKKDEGSMGSFTARLLKIPQSERQQHANNPSNFPPANMDESMMGGQPQIGPMMPQQDGGGNMGGMGGNMGGNMGGGNMMMQGNGAGGGGGPGGFYGGGPMGGPMGQMMGMPGNMMMGQGPMMGPGPGAEMMFGGMGWGGPMGEGGPMPMMPPKEIIRVKNSVLYPPPPNAPPPSTRDRPPGCRTIFVGGLPETATEDMLQEVFQEFGTITSVRKSKKKNFAHVRYEEEGMVEPALFLSGYRMKVEDKDDKPNTGRLHVDYAMARDDQFEYECRQRSLMRDMRHRQRLEEERMRPPSPPLVTQYSDYESNTLLEKLKTDDDFMKGSQVLLTWLERGEVNRRNINNFYTDDDFMKGSQVLLTWLERGEVNRRNINNFYSMIQCTNSHIRRLMTEKQGHEEELTQMKEKFKNIFEGILRQFDQIEKVFMTAQKQRNWDHFTKAQRKNIELWLKQAKEIKASQQEEFFSSRQEDEMEMSDDEDGMGGMGSGGGNKRKKTDFSQDMTNQYVEMAGKLNQINNLKDENQSLQRQVEAYKNELALSKSANGASSAADRQKEVTALQMAMQGMQKQLIQARSEMSDYKKSAEKEKLELMVKLQTEKSKLQVEMAKARERDEKDKSGDKSNVETDGLEIIETDSSKSKAAAADVSSSTGLHVTEKEAQLIGLVCCFLHVHPTGASLDYIWSYLHRLDISCRVSELENLLEKIPTIFRQEVSGVGATIERRWTFTGYTGL